MNDLALSGRNRTIRVFASVLLISIYTIVTYSIVVENVETEKITQQAVRFLLTLLLMYFIFKERRWAVMLATLLFSIAAIGGLITLFSKTPFISKIPFVSMTIIYTFTVYHLNFSERFQEFLRYKNLEKSEFGRLFSLFSVF